MDFREVGSLVMEDFSDALAQLLPSAPDKLKQTRYKLAASGNQNGEVDIPRLALVRFLFVVMYMMLFF